jgi:hypothetical protein
MLQNGHVVLSDDIVEKQFVCDLLRCKGACCVEGDAGAPLEQEELDILDKEYANIKPYLDPKGIAAIEEQGLYVLDDDGDFTTPTLNGRECAYAIYDKDILKCGIEKAWKEGKTDFMKPISCHLYPIRSQKFGMQYALNYDRWQICAPACDNGKTLGVPVYKFVKSALIRKFGEDWYNDLEDLAKDVR